MTTTNSQPENSADLTAVQTVFARLVEYWNNADGSGYGTLFTSDADYIDVTGTRTIGGDAIGRVHQFLFDGPLKGSKLDANGSSPDVKFLASDVALVVQGGASRLAGQAEATTDRQSVNTTVLVRQNGEWKIRAFQNNRVQPFTMPPIPAQPK